MSGLRAQQLASSISPGADDDGWLEDLVQGLLMTSKQVRSEPLLSPSAFFGSLFGGEAREDRVDDGAFQPLDGATAVPGTPSTVATVAAAALGAAFEARTVMAAELERLVALEVLIAEATVLVAASRAAETAWHARETLAATAAEAADAIGKTVSRTAAEVRDRTAASAARVAEAASLAAIVVEAAAQTPHADPALAAARVAAIVAEVAAASTLEADLAAKQVADDAIGASLRTASAASAAETAFLSSVRLAADRAKADAALAASQVAEATRVSRRVIAAGVDGAGPLTSASTPAAP